MALGFGKKDESKDEKKEKGGFLSRFRKGKKDKDDTPEQTPELEQEQMSAETIMPEAPTESPTEEPVLTTPASVESAPEEATGTQTEQAETPTEAHTDTAEEKKAGFFSKLKSGLQKTRGAFKGKLDSLFLATRKIDEDLLEELEEMLISADIGVQTAMDIIEQVRRDVDRKALKDAGELKTAIQEQLLTILNNIPKKPFDLDKGPTILLVVGVNGVGKTTTIGKLSRRFVEDGKSVVVCAADTFRAAAVEQLQVWAKRAGCDIVAKEGGKDPAAVVYDALERVKETGADVLIIDTAGRLHNNPNLMNELEKIYRIIGRSYEAAPHHVLLILDAVTGQNGLQQAKQFVGKVGVTDLIITKLDGTAKGGIAIGIAKELDLPIQFVGVGEQMDDLLPFNAENFVRSLFEDE